MKADLPLSITTIGKHNAMLAYYSFPVSKISFQTFDVDIDADVIYLKMTGMIFSCSDLIFSNPSHVSNIIHSNLHTSVALIQWLVTVRPVSWN